MPIFLQINEDNDASKESMQSHWHDNGTVYSTLDEA